MRRNKVIVIFNNYKTGQSSDIEIPIDITANELVSGLNSAYDLGIDTTNIKECYLKAENPIALLRGNKTLDEFGIRDGSIINFTA